MIQYAFEELGLGNGINYIIDAHELLWEEEKIVGIKMANQDCEHDCANCKISKVKELKHKFKDKKLVYVGDGFTDYLPAPLADYIFARKNMPLHKFLSKKEIDHKNENNGKRFLIVPNTHKFGLRYSSTFSISAIQFSSSDCSAIAIIASIQI